jgi:hypothetical protein
MKKKLRFNFYMPEYSVSDVTVYELNERYPFPCKEIIFKSPYLVL